MSDNNTFAIAEVMPGKLNALVKNIMRQTGQADPNEAVRLVNSGEWVVSKPARRWREQDGVIRFSVTSDGTTGEGWIMRLESKRLRVVDYARSVLWSPDFKPTNGVTTEIAVLKGELFEDNERTTKDICAVANKWKLVKPNAELACLIREMFTDKELEEMGLWVIIAMHEPIKDSARDLDLLGARRSDVGQWLDTSCGSPDRRWSRESGFAFVVPQVGS